MFFLTRQFYIDYGHCTEIEKYDMKFCAKEDGRKRGDVKKWLTNFLYCITMYYRKEVKL